MRGEVLKFFKERFLDSMESNPCLNGVILLCLSHVKASLIYFDFTPIDIDVVVKDIYGCKSLA